MARCAWCQTEWQELNTLEQGYTCVGKGDKNFGQSTGFRGGNISEKGPVRLH